MSKGLRGIHNSSITRVRPVFQQLIRNQPTGEPWIRQMLALAGTDGISGIGELLPELTTTIQFTDRILKHYGVGTIDLERCFEMSLPPPTRFLEWLIRNPEKMIYRANSSGDAEILKLRDDLFGKNGSDAQTSAQDVALSELQVMGASQSDGEWWAFEGWTEVDCYLETDKYVLLVEGKRTEKLSPGTFWFAVRNQLIRNLEVGQEVAAAKKKNYGVLLIAEKPIALDIEKEAEIGLPHMDNNEREELLKHYLGCLTWEAVCESTGIDFASLPDETAQAAEKLRGLG